VGDVKAITSTASAVKKRGGGIKQNYPWDIWKKFFLKLADANLISIQNYLMTKLASGNPGH
jgi:hypothetical protein